jgi:hypothetical protein
VATIWLIDPEVALEWKEAREEKAKVDPRIHLDTEDD